MANTGQIQMNDILKIKRQNSDEKISNLQSELSNCNEVKGFEHLTVFVAGSYGRREASEFSDVDLFFVLDGSLEKITGPNLKSLRMFAKVIEIADRMRFPKFSNDGQYLQIIAKPRILAELGGPNDDHQNFFTARMLMILESTCVYNQHSYDNVFKDVVGAYFRDYPDHPKDFAPTFLVNDIIRFWKTLCLNYENKRNSRKTILIKRLSRR